MQLQIIQVPYDSGYRERRQGLGPVRFMDEGIDRVLASDGHDVAVSRVDASTAFTTEITTAFDVNRALSAQVAAAVQNGRFPLVLAGNCTACLGCIGGIGHQKLGVIWFDAHGEFNTPETTLSGFLDGMPLAMTTGRCWRSLSKTVPGFEPIPDLQVLLVGAADLDRAEEEMFAQSEIAVVPCQNLDADRFISGFGKSLLNLKQCVDAVYLHVDMDILDFDGVFANHLSTSGGMSTELLKAAISMIKRQFTIKACTMASYDPANDPDGLVVSTGIQVLRHIVGQ